jgi:hypothetical protein
MFSNATRLGLDSEVQVLFHSVSDWHCKIVVTEIIIKSRLSGRSSESPVISLTVHRRRHWQRDDRSWPGHIGEPESPAAPVTAR